MIMSIIEFVFKYGGSAGIVLIVKYLFPDVKAYYVGRREAKKLFYTNIDLLTKSIDELYGKLHSLAKEDFGTFVNSVGSNSLDISNNKIYVYYLFSQFWGHIELLRINKSYASLSRINKGRELIKFISTYESRKYRILDRSLQRSIGESVIEESENGYRIMTFNSFKKDLISRHSQLASTIYPLEMALHEVSMKNKKQRILIYGATLYSFLHHFDNKYRIARERKLYDNKLNKNSIKTIKHSLYKRYLPFFKPEGNIWFEFLFKDNFWEYCCIFFIIALLVTLQYVLLQRLINILVDIIRVFVR